MISALKKQVSVLWALVSEAFSTATKAFNASADNGTFAQIDATAASLSNTVITDTTPTLHPTVSGKFLVVGVTSGHAGAGLDAMTVDLDYSLDGGTTWTTVQQVYPSLPAAGTGANDQVLGSFSHIISQPTSVGSAAGIKFRLVANPAGGTYTVFAATGQGLYAVELAA